MTYIEREREFTFAKNYKKSMEIFQSYDHKCAASCFMVHSV